MFDSQTRGGINYECSTARHAAESLANVRRTGSTVGAWSMECVTHGSVRHCPPPHSSSSSSRSSRASRSRVTTQTQHHEEEGAAAARRSIHYRSPSPSSIRHPASAAAQPNIPIAATGATATGVALDYYSCNRIIITLEPRYLY